MRKTLKMTHVPKRRIEGSIMKLLLKENGIEEHVDPPFMRCIDN